MKALSVVGARPQFIKSLAVSRALRARHTEVLVHTGQHYDYEMSKVFFEGLNLPEPDYNLGVGSGNHGEQTGRMLMALEGPIAAEGPNVVLVYGDTNSTLAGALAAAKLNVPVAHVEAGLRSYNRSMPEEINRVVADHVSSMLFCPTPHAVENLAREGIRDGVVMTGDVMIDAARLSAEAAGKTSSIMRELSLRPRGYFLATVHRASNTDKLGNLERIVEAFLALELPVVFPVHPRTRKSLEQGGLFERIEASKNVRLIPPQGYLDFVELERNARAILTDSGGIQKEACFYGVPCVTLREETEWVETVERGYNTLVGADKDAIVQAAERAARTGPLPPARDLYGDGHAAEKIVAALESFTGKS